MPRVNCQGCGAEFHVDPWRLEKGGGKYCSRQCLHESLRRGETRQCPVYGTEFLAQPFKVKRGWAIYCSRQCLHFAAPKGEIKQCQHCGNAVYRTLGAIRKSHSQLFFCSRSCRASWTNKQFAGERHWNWKDFGRNYRKKLLWAGVAPICNRCGNSDFRLLIVHHLDADRKNQQLLNLVWMCRNCHFLIHHYPEEMDAFMATLQTNSSTPRSSNSAPSSE